LLAAEDALLESVRGAAADGSLRLGFSQDFVDTVLPAVLSRSTARFPRIRFEVRIDGHSHLVDAIANGRLDLALSLGRVDGPGTTALGEVELVWIAGSDVEPRRAEPLPLVLLGPGCAMRARATDALDAAGVAWRVAATSPSLSGLWATVSAGLGVTARTRLGLPAGLMAERRLFGLPPLGDVPIALHGAPHEARSPVLAIRAMVRESVEPLIRTRPDSGPRRRSPSSRRRRSPARDS
jgi:DNA-binding transcriptional LysR family regulator